MAAHRSKSIAPTRKAVAAFQAPSGSLLARPRCTHLRSISSRVLVAIRREHCTEARQLAAWHCMPACYLVHIMHGSNSAMKQHQHVQRRVCMPRVTRPPHARIKHGNIRCCAGRVPCSAARPCGCARAAPPPLQSPVPSWLLLLHPSWDIVVITFNSFLSFLRLYPHT